MNRFDYGFLSGAVGMFVVMVAGFEISQADVVYPEEVLQATSSCKEGDWIKIDQTTIYCADGAEYKRGK
ncbi:hypothetical protein [Pseudoalteromonas phage PH357]|nr:hypothetical protein [Pseudoalteromonas phage PH357]